MHGAACVGERKCAGSACRCAGTGEGFWRGMGGEGGGRASSRGGGAEVRGKGVRKCPGRARRCAGASGGLRRGMCCEGGEECIAQPAGVRRRGEGVRKCSGRARRCAGAGADLRRGMCCEGGEECIVAGRGSGSVRGGSGSARRGRVAVRGRAEVFGGEWVVRSAGLTHIRRSSTRARVLLYIRPPCPRREIAAMGPKGAFCEYPSPAKTSAPAPSAFALPCPRSHFPRIAFGLPPNDFRTRPSAFALSCPRSHFPRIAFRGPRRTIGIPQQQLSTMGYPRKSYPHRCSPPCAKRSRPRACARVYIISRSPVGCSRGVSALLPKRVRAVVAPCPAPPCAGWGRAKAKADAPSRSAEPCRLCVESLCAKAECTRPTPPPPVRSPRGNLSTAAPLPACVPNHCVQRRKRTGPTPPLPVRSPRGNLSTAAPPLADGRSAVRKGGSAQGNPRPCPCVLPATACLPPRPCPLMGEAPCAGWGRAKAKADAPSHSNPPLPVRSPRGNLSTAPPPPSKWAPRRRRREGKPPNGAPPHRNAHTPNAERKRYLHNSRTKTQRRTKRCAQFVIFVFTPCKLLHNFSTVLHRSPREVPKRAQIAARRPDFPCFTARFSPLRPESHCAKHPRTAPVLPPKNAPLRAYAKPRSHLRVRGTRQHATTCAFFTFSVRYGRIGSPPKTNFCPAEGRKWGRLRSQMLKNGLQTKKSTFSFGRLVI